MKVLTGKCRGCNRLFVRGTHRHAAYCSLSCALWGRIDKRGPDECWEWKASKLRSGYGVFNYDGVYRRAHREIFELVKKPLGNLLACHTCDNPPCCNPAHLFAGTKTDNALDMMRKKRGKHAVLFGPNNVTTKLSDHNVIQARARYKAGESFAKLAAEFSINKEHMWSVVTYRARKNLP